LLENMHGSPITRATPFPSDELILDPLKLDQTFDPDNVAYQLLSDVYRPFGYKPECITFYNDAAGVFVF